MSPGNEFDAFINKNLSHLLPQREKDGSRVLYHYTNIDALSAMTSKNADFMCTYCATMNDKAEFFTGLNVLEKYVSRYPSAVESLHMGAIREIAFQPQYAPWSLSFSAEGDSLNQWISYTDRNDGGVAIGFDIARIYDAITQKKSRTSIMFLAPCLYEKSHEKEIGELFDFLFGSYKEELVTLGCDSNHGTTASKARELVSLLVALMFASIVKDESFRLEHEWRLVLHPVDAERTRNYIYVSGKPRLFSELFGSDFGLADSIKRIVCSPHGRSLDKARVIASLRQLSVIPESSKSTYIVTR